MNVKPWLAAAVACGLSTAMAAQAQALVRVQLLKDTNTEFAGDLGAAHSFVRIDGDVYFSATTPSTGTELFKTSGAPGDVRLVADLTPGQDSTYPRALGSAGQTIIIASNAPNWQGGQLWGLSSDAPLLLTPNAGPISPSSDSPRAVGNVGGRLIVRSPHWRKFWSTDGTVAGTFALDDDPSFPVAGQRLGETCQLPDAVVMRMVDWQFRERLVRADGTAAGTLVLQELGDTASAIFTTTQFVPLDGRCYIANRRAPGTWALWRTDGTAAGTSVVSTIDTAFPRDLATLNGQIYAAVELPGATDDIGTFRVIRFDVAGVSPPQTVLETTAFRDSGTLIATDNALLARTRSTDNEALYFLSDGTLAGTRLLNSANPNIAPMVGQLYAFGSTVLVASTLAEQYGIRIDTTSGSVSPQSVTAKIDMGSVAAIGGKLLGAGFWSAEGGLWSTDASEAGTRQIAAIAPTTQDGVHEPSLPLTRPIVDGDVLVFNSTLRTESPPWSLWRTDGTEAGTRALQPSQLNGRTPYSAIAYGGEILVKARDAESTAQLFATDPAFAHVTPLWSFYSGGKPLMRAGSAVLVDCASQAPPASAGLCLLVSAQTQPTPLVMLNNNEFSPIGHVGTVAIFGGPTAGVWRSDGTIAGTYQLLVDGTYTWTTEQPSALVDGRLYFRTCRGGICSLASTDGTVTGTRLIASMPSGDITRIERFGNGVTYATNLKRVLTLYVSDGTTAGTRAIYTTERVATGAPALAVVGDRIHVLASFFTPSLYLVSDGTQGGEHEVALPAGVTLATGFVAALNDTTAVFACRGPAIGEELCAVDREGSQAVVVADIRPGSLDSRPRVLGQTADTLYLVANDGIHGSEPCSVRAVGEQIFVSGFEVMPRKVLNEL